MLTPVIADLIIPGLERLRVQEQVCVLTPSLEALDSLQTLVECLEDHINELRVVRDQLDPVVLDFGCDFAVLLDKLVVIVFFILFRFLFFTIFTNCSQILDLQMSQQVKVLMFRFASRGWQEFFNGLVLNLIIGERCLIIQDNVGVEQGVLATLGSASAGVIEFHGHDGIHIRDRVKFFDTHDHV